MRERTGGTTAAMEGGGAYNRNSALQAANLVTALPLLEEAADAVPVTGEAPLVIADYGASQGRNSMLPIGLALDRLRARTGAERPIEVVHTDLASNDFQSLFMLLAEDPASYLSGRENVYAAAIGRSYLQPILPPERVLLGWSSNALHWMSSSPAEVPDHGWAVFSESREAREAVDTVLADDWRAFLLARASELRIGGRLVCQLMGRGAEQHGFEWMAGACWQSLVDMGNDGLLTSQELSRMTCPAAGRSVEQLEAPFRDGTFSGLSLTHLEIAEQPDPFWQSYSESGDRNQLGRSWAMAMRTANGPNFVSGLDPHRDAGAFLDGLTERLAARVAGDPQRSRSYLALVAIEKVGPAD